MRKAFLFVAICFTFLPFGQLYAQQNVLMAESMTLLDNDLEAYGNQVLDANNQPTALIKVALPLSNVVFEGDGIVKTVDKSGEYWVYVTVGEDYGAERLVIKQSGFYPLEVRFSQLYLFKEELQGKRTYRLVVSVPSELLRQANIEYNSMRFRKAKESYMAALENPEATEADRHLAKKRLNDSPSLDTLAMMATAADQFARQAQSMKKRGAKKTEITDTLTEAIRWFDKLAAVTGSSVAVRLSESLTKTRDAIAGTAVLDVTLALMEKQQMQRKKKDGIVVKRNTRKLKSVKVYVVRNGKTLKSEVIDTDNESHFKMEVEQYYGSELVVECNYENNTYRGKCAITGDSYIELKLYNNY